MERGAATALRRDIDRALQPLNDALHDIHANAAAGYLRDLVGGAEPGLEN